ncbi:MAG: hypothetical protein KIG86_02815, partial [Eubacteriales bacterium]|nr:hypothetical protein [Eubacteriales bacterium]
MTASATSRRRGCNEASVVYVNPSVNPPHGVLPAPRPEPLKKGEKSGKIGVREVKERMNGQQSFTDIEYTNRKRATKR